LNRQLLLNDLPSLDSFTLVDLRFYFTTLLNYVLNFFT